MLVLGRKVDPTGTLRLSWFNFGMVCSFVQPWLAHVLLERRISVFLLYKHGAL